MTEKNRFIQHLARAYVKRRLGRTFSDVRILGASRLRAALDRGPVIVASNHVSWWDPLVMVHLDAKLKSDAYCLMDKANLDGLRFFSWLGALPLDRSSPRASLRDLERAAILLSEPGRMLVVFPHGEQRPAHLPLEFRSGVHSLFTKTGAPVYPLALRYDFHQSDRPVIHLALGEPLSERNLRREEFLRRLEGSVREQLELVDREIEGEKLPFESLLGRRVDIHRAHLPPGTGALKKLALGESKN